MRTRDKTTPLCNYHLFRLKKCVDFCYYIIYGMYPRESGDKPCLCHRSYEMYAVDKWKHHHTILERPKRKIFERWSTLQVRKKCPTCDWSWLDKYNKNECPKCMNLLVPSRLVPTRYRPGSSMESESGSCKQGGQHKWKYGKCSQCGLSEGYGRKPLTAPILPQTHRLQIQGKCSSDGNRHTFKFSRCTKCGTRQQQFVDVTPLLSR